MDGPPLPEDWLASVTVSGGSLDDLLDLLQGALGGGYTDSDSDTESGGSSSTAEYDVDWLVCTEGGLEEEGWVLRGTAPLGDGHLSSTPGNSPAGSPVESPPASPAGATPGEWVCGVCHATLTDEERIGNGTLAGGDHEGVCNNCLFGPEPPTLTDLWTD